MSENWQTIRSSCRSVSVTCAERCAHKTIENILNMQPSISIIAFWSYVFSLPKKAEIDFLIFPDNVRFLLGTSTKYPCLMLTRWWRRDGIVVNASVNTSQHFSWSVAVTSWYLCPQSMHTTESAIANGISLSGKSVLLPHTIIETSSPLVSVIIFLSCTTRSNVELSVTENTNTNTSPSKMAIFVSSGKFGDPDVSVISSKNLSPLQKYVSSTVSLYCCKNDVFTAWWMRAVLPTPGAPRRTTRTWLRKLS